MKYILAFDAGTTSVRAIVFDQEGRIQSVAQKEIRQIFPKPGWVEQDPQEIWFTQMTVAVEALGRARIRPSDIAGDRHYQSAGNHHRLGSQDGRRRL
jgi:glycerol kinase